MKAEDARTIAQMARAPRRSDHWGPYCTVPPLLARDGSILYVHLVYPVPSGHIREDDGTTRPMTDKELEVLSRCFDERIQVVCESVRDPRER